MMTTTEGIKITLTVMHWELHNAIQLLSYIIIIVIHDFIIWIAVLMFIVDSES